MYHWVVVLRPPQGVADPIDRSEDSRYRLVHHIGMVRYSVDRGLVDNPVYRNIYCHRCVTNRHTNLMADCTSQHRYLNTSVQMDIVSIFLIDYGILLQLANYGELLLWLWDIYIYWNGHMLYSHIYIIILYL